MKGEWGMRTKGRIAVITGAGSGIGKATALTLAQEGAAVVASDVNLHSAEKVADEIKAGGGSGLAQRADVTGKGDMTRLIQTTLEKFGRVDIMVNNAGISGTTPIEEMTKEEWDRVMDINLWGVFLGCQTVLKPMREQRYGKIVNISSLAAKVGGIFIGINYSCAKAGVICMTKSFAKALAPYGVNVNAICPGPIETPFHSTTTKEQREALIKSTPLGKFGEPEDIAETILFLVSDSARHITGEIIDVNGGMLMD
jgi:3-oxoacyl-[acyl-carrier protein] reductase